MAKKARQDGHATLSVASRELLLLLGRKLWNLPGICIALCLCTPPFRPTNPFLPLPSFSPFDHSNAASAFIHCSKSSKDLGIIIAVTEYFLSNLAIFIPVASAVIWHVCERVKRLAKRWGCLLSYSQAEPGRELTQPSPHLLAEPCRS